MLKKILKKIDANHQYSLGIKEHNQGRYENAVQLYHRAIEKFEDHFKSHYALAGFYYETQQWDKALIHFKKVQELKHYTYQIDMFIGICEMGLGNLGEALRRLNTQNNKTPNNPDVIGNRSTVYLRMNDYESALKDIDTAIEIDPSNSFAYAYKGETLASIGKHEESILLFDIAYEKAPNNLQTLMFKAISLIELNRFDEALETLNYLIDKSPSSNELYCKRGEIYLKKGDEINAKLDLEKAFQMGNAKAKELLMNFSK